MVIFSHHWRKGTSQVPDLAIATIWFFVALSHKLQQLSKEAAVVDKGLWVISIRKNKYTFTVHIEIKRV